MTEEKETVGLLGRRPAMSKDRGLLKRGNKWVIHYYHNGKRYRETVGESKTEARQALASRKTQIKEGRFFPNKKHESNTLWEEFLPAFIKWAEKHLKAIGIESIPICIAGMEGEEEFRAVIRQKTKNVMDVRKVESEVVKIAKELVEKCSDIGAIVFECANLAPYAYAVQKATNLPVFDIVTLTNMVYSAVVKHRFIFQP